MSQKTQLRADAERNRERILIAAEEVFSERGASVSLEDVAKRAGVGIGTLYRRFPTREALLAAAYSERFVTFAAVSRERAAELDPLSALRLYLEELVGQTILYRGFAASLGTVLQVGTPGCLAANEEGIRLLSQAHQVGVVRRDVTFNDLVCMAIAISLSTEQDSAPQANIARLVDVFLNGARLPAA